MSRLSPMQGGAQLPASFVIRGGRVIDPANGIDTTGDLAVVDGRIASLEKLPSTPAAIIDATGLIVCPGLIDMHVHLREPGGEDKETIETGTRAAAAGGFTSVASMPNTTPPIDNPALLEWLRHRAEATGSCRVYPVAAITVGRGGVRVVDIKALVKAGAIAFSDDGDGVQDDDVMREAFELARSNDALIIQHCEFKSLSAGGVMHRGTVSERLGLPGIDPAAEEAMIERDLGLLRRCGGRYHVAHISTARSVELVRAAKAQGLNVTAEVCIHHLSLTDEACDGQDPNTKMHPPLRSKRDVQACLDGLCDATIDCVVTDHAPHTAEEKNTGFRRAPFGIVGLESAVALAARTLVGPGLLDWSGLIRRMSRAPASILGLEGGTLAVGASADISLIDPEIRWTIDPTQFQSLSRNTPFGGWQVGARPVASMVSGKLTHLHRSMRQRFIPS